MRKVLITGGQGFIGINLLKKLRANEEVTEIHVLDNNDSKDLFIKAIGVSKSIKLIKGSILDPNLSRILDKEYDYIIHTAAILGIKKVAEESVDTLNVNIIGTRNCLEIAKSMKSLKGFLYLSTSEVYGPNAYGLNENDPAIIPSTGKRWCYAASKLTGEQYVKAYAAEYSIPYIIIRPFNIYGPLRYGSNAISLFISNALNNINIEISGDGSQKRSWCYIDDFVDATLFAMLEVNISNETFNLGNPNCYLSIRDLAILIIKLSNSKSNIIITNSLIEDVQDRKPNIVKAQKMLNYNPLISLEEGLAKTINWMKNGKS